MLLYCQVSKNPVKTKGFADLVLRKNAVWQEDLAIGRACFIQKTMLIELLMFNKISGNSGLHSRNTRRFVEGNANLYQPMQSYSFARRIGSTGGSGDTVFVIRV